MLRYLKTVFILIMLSSCTFSLFPVTDKEEDLIFKKELLGNWKVIKEKGKVSSEYENDVSYIIDTLNGSGGKRYKISCITTYSDPVESDTSYLLGMIVKLEQGYFIDCSTDTSREAFRNLDELAKGFLLSTHTITRFKIQDENTISIFHIDPEKMEELVKAKKLVIKYTFSDKEKNYLILLEPTSALQKKLNEPGGLIKAFTWEETIKRQ